MVMGMGLNDYGMLLFDLLVMRRGLDFEREVKEQEAEEVERQMARTAR